MAVVVEVEVEELGDVHVQDLVVFHFLSGVFQNDHHDHRASESQSPHSNRNRPAESLR